VLARGHFGAVALVCRKGETRAADDCTLVAKYEKVRPDARRSREALEREDTIARSAGVVGAGPVVRSTGFCGPGDSLHFNLMDRYPFTLANAPASLVEDVAKIQRKVSEAVALLHGAGYYHADIKPDNVVINEDGDVRLIDFTLARQLGAPETYQMARSYARDTLGSNLFYRALMSKGFAVRGAGTARGPSMSGPEIDNVLSYATVLHVYRRAGEAKREQSPTGGRKRKRDGEDEESGAAAAKRAR